MTTVYNCCNKKDIAAKCRQFVSKSQLVYRMLMSANNKVKRICLLTSQQLVTVTVRHTHVILLIWRALRL